jgi:hypothetical protein
MLITIWGMCPLNKAHTKALKEDIAIAVSEHTKRSIAAIRVNFSPTPIRPPGMAGPIRILPTGADANGHEYRIVGVIGALIDAQMKGSGCVWCGFEHPHLAGQKK